VGPTLIGVIKQATGNYAAAMLVQSAGLVVATAIILMVGRAIASHEVQPA
jgi:cyanate permease